LKFVTKNGIFIKIDDEKALYLVEKYNWKFSSKFDFRRSKKELSEYSEKLLLN